MSRKIKFDSSQNPAMNFAVIVRELEKIAQERDLPTTEIIDMFILDLQNYYDGEYKKKVDIDLNGVTPVMRSSFISYLNKMKRTYKQNESRKSKKEANVKKKADTEQKMQKKWKEIQDSIKGNIIDDQVMEKIISDIESSDLSRKEKNYMKIKLDEKRKKFIETWRGIEGIVERMSSENDNKTKPEYWQAIRDLITQRDKRLSIRMDEEMEKEMISMIDDKIAFEKDELYYDQVKAFTRDFSFLKEESFVARAVTGTKVKKFTDRESFDRYCNLKTLLQEGYKGEYSKITELLNSDKVDNADKRILQGRLSVMEKETRKMPDAR